MQLFLIVLTEEVADTVKSEAEKLPLIQDTHVMTDQALLVQSYVSNPQVISDMLRISENAELPQVGVVFKLNGSYSGYFYPQVWEWLAATRSEGSVA